MLPGLVVRAFRSSLFRRRCFVGGREKFLKKMKFSFLGDFRVFLCSLCVGWLGLPSVYPSKLELLVWLVGNNNNNIECPILRTAENYTVHNTTTIGMFFCQVEIAVQDNLAKSQDGF